ncbi:MAG: 3-oxoacyl-ACP synthase, partial [Crocinitomicaceae bacterium]
MNKKELLHFLISELKKKQLFLEQELKALSESLGNSAKSSAGDKHETDTAMNQLEQEQLMRQLLALQSQQQLVHQLNPETKHARITTGSLVKTSKALFFISVGIGKIHFQELDV